VIDQLKDVILVHNDVEGVLNNIIKETFLSPSHVHNVELLECLVQLENHMEVRVAIRGMDAFPRAGLVGDAIYITTMLQHNLTEEVVSILHAGLEKNDMGLFSYFVWSNEKIFSPSQIECVQ
jgi:hypothetical protein